MKPNSNTELAPIVVAVTDAVTGGASYLNSGGSRIFGLNPGAIQADIAPQLDITGLTWTVTQTAGSPSAAKDATKVIASQPGVAPLVIRGSASADGQYVRATATIPATSSSDLSISIPIHIEDYTKIQSVLIAFSKDGFATTQWYATHTVSQAGNLDYNGEQILGLSERAAATSVGFVSGMVWQQTGGGTTADSFTSIRIQVAFLNGSAGSGVWFGNPIINGKGRARLSIELDDGSSTIFQRVTAALPWNAVQYMYSKGLRATFNLIYSLIGTAGYITAADVGRLLDMGMHIGVHGATSLASLGNDAARRADILANYNGLLGLGVPSEMLLAHYAYPNGVYERTSTPGDQEIITAVRELGFKTARTAARRQFQPNYAGYHCQYTENILGHYDAGYAGGVETIAIDTARLRLLVSSGGFGTFLFHQFVDTTLSDNIQITLTDFITFIDLVSGFVQAGTLDVVTPMDNVAYYGL